MKHISKKGLEAENMPPQKKSGVEKIFNNIRDKIKLDDSIVKPETEEWENLQ